MTYKKEKTQYTGDWKNDKKEGEGILAKFINNTYKEMITTVFSNSRVAQTQAISHSKSMSE